MAGQGIGLDEAGEMTLALLRTKGLSIKALDESKKEEVRRLLDRLHNENGMSLNDIAKLIGNKTSGYTSWLCRQLGVPRRPFEEARLKGIREKRRKYERRPFDGTDEDKAYLLGLRHGDLSVSVPFREAIRVSTSTTHPAMASLFRSLFSPYGHVYQHPRFKRGMKSYEWNLSVILDSSFGFLLQSFSEVRSWLDSDRGVLLSYLSGLLDAEGSIITTRDRQGYATIFVDYYNSDRVLLDWVQESIRSLGYQTSLRLNKAKGTKTKKYGIVHLKDYWQLSTYGMDRVQLFLSSLRIRHPEKIRRRLVALKLSKRTPYSTYEAENNDLRVAIKNEVAEFVKVAQEEFIAKHPQFQNNAKLTDWIGKSTTMVG